MKKQLIATLVLLCTYVCHAQTKVFKEVSADISSQMKVIYQDRTLVGYLVFTTLEKASEDSFNYKITIMDENLNDIGTVNFRDQRLDLRAVTFEQDVLCLAYLRSNFIGASFKNKKAFKDGLDKAKTSILFQFLNLDGKIIERSVVKTEATYVTDWRYTNFTGRGWLKHPVQLQNMSGKGFACFYADETKKNIIIYNTKGQPTWVKPIKEDAEGFSLLTSGSNAYLLAKKKDAMLEGGFEILGFGTSDSSTFPKYTLKDKQGNALKVITFDIDPVTEKPYASGYIINPDRGNRFSRPQEVKKGTYNGVFTVNLNGPTKKEINEVYSYWNDGSQSFISARGRFTEDKTVARYVNSFKDYEGNTYFAGSAYKTKPKWVSVGFTVVTIPLILPPLYIAFFGYTKAKEDAPVLLKQTPKGVITINKTIEGNSQSYIKATAATDFSLLSNRKYYCMSSSEKKSNYILIDDRKDIFVYHVSQNKVIRKIPHKDGNSYTYVYPAKEGHVLVSEYNQKERSTRYSIEAL